MGAAILTISRDGEAVKSVPIEGEAVLGRSEGCVIRLDDRAVSRQHALFRPVAGGVQVEKKSDFAPFSVNGSEVTSALLKEGDVISIGPYLVKVGMDKPGSPQFAPRVTETAEAAAAFDAVQSASNSDSDSEAPSAPEMGAPLDIAPKHENPPGAQLSEMPELGELVNAAVSESKSAGGMASEFGDLGAPAAPAPPASEAPMLEMPDLGAAPADPLADALGKVDASSSMVIATPGASSSEPLSFDVPPSDIPAVTDGSTPFEAASEDGATKISGASKLDVRLFFNPGEANVQEFVINKDEISIGRGGQCDVILNDKKVSRKHALIIRNGFRFTLRDLRSANGAYVNGLRVEEHDLESGDKIRIGNVEFAFQATSPDYERNQKDFLPVPEVSGSGTRSGGFQGGGLAALPNDLSGVLSPPPSGLAPYNSAGKPTGLNIAGQPQGQPGQMATGIAGINSINGATKPKTLMQKFRALPKRSQYIWMAFILGVLYFGLFDDEDAKAPKKAQPKQAVQAQASGKPDVNFDSLTPEQKRFVENQHSLAFDYYRAREYDKALFEIEKIFTLIPDYKDSREIERYAREGKRKLEAMEEEQRKKEEEAKLKAKVASLVEETRQLMAKKAYEQARELFAQILALDPDNKEVAQWRETLEQYEERRRLEEQEKMVQKEINDRAWGIFNDAMELKKESKYRDAIDVFGKVAEIGATDKSVNVKAQAQIEACKAAIAAMLNPVLADAKSAEQGGDLPKAFSLYKKATEIDPPDQEGYKGMDRIRGVLHERAKVTYTEAVLAESYSDFETAKKKYQETLATAPADDIYHGRAERKLSRFLASKAEEQPTQ